MKNEIFIWRKKFLIASIDYVSSVEESFQPKKNIFIEHLSGDLFE